MKNLNRSFILFLLCFYFAGCSNLTVRKQASDKLKGIILIGWDGTQREHLKELLKDGKLPNLKRLIDEGCLLDLDVVESDTSTKAGEVGRKLADYIARFKDDRFFIFVQFEEPDELGHAYGGNSIGYTKGLIIDDAWLGKTVDLLKKLKIYEKTLIYVVSDHGFTRNSKEHDYAPTTFLATNDRCLRNKRSERKDITLSILRRYGVNIKKIKPPLEGQSLY